MHKPTKGDGTIDRAKLNDLAQQSRQRSVRLRVGTLLDGASQAPMRDADLVFTAQEIVSVTPHDGAEPDLWLKEATVLPCLIEAHAHLFLDGAPVNFQQREQYLKETPEYMLSRARARWPKILECGIGAVRDAGDKHNVGLSLAAESKQFASVLRPTPYIDSPGAAIHHKGRYGSFMGQPVEDHASPAACVASRVQQGADRIKLLVSGIINFKVGQVTTPPQMSVDEVREFVAAAHEHHRQTFAHASGTEGVEHSIEGGVNTVEHGFFITPEQLAKMRDRNIAWVPTFAPVQVQIDRAAELGWSDEIVSHLKRIIESHQNMLRLAHEMGVRLVAGSDAGSCGVAHGVGFLWELEQMQRAGVPAWAVINSATGTSAATLHFPEKIGRLAPHHRARFIITEHNPLQAVANLQRQKTILFDGRAVHAPDTVDTDGL
ncbi:MAG TPA: amidohydrolase family protein [Tepidisphaeraceae bacterium]|jgi:imidazolonepropionase-like amidohydrolase